MPDIIIHDGPAPQNPQFVGREALPQIIGGLEPGQYRVINTAASPQVTVYDAITGLPAFTTTLNQMIEVTGFAPGSDPISFTIDSGPFASTFVHTLSSDDLAQSPVNLVRPNIVGTPEDGRTLTGVPGLWVSFSASVTRQADFLRDGVVIEGATGGGGLYDFYTVEVDTDAGTTIQYRENLTDAAGTRASARTGLFVEAPDAGAGLENGLTDFGTFSNTQSGFDRSIPVALGAADPEKKIIMLITMDGNITSSTVRIEAGGVDYPLTAIQSYSAGSMRLRLYEGSVPVGGAATVKWTQAVGFEKVNFVQLLAAKGVNRKSQIGTSPTVPDPVTPITQNVAVAADDYAIHAVVAAPGAGLFTGTSFGTKITDATGANSSRIYTALGKATAANAALALSVTPPAPGAAIQFAAVYGA